MHDPSDARRRRALGWIVFAAVAVTLASPFVGFVAVAWDDVAAPFRDGGEPWSVGARAFWGLRVPRTLAAAVAGGALALGGVAFQALFRNPLAEPFVLGVSAGASAGLALSLAGAAALGGVVGAGGSAWVAALTAFAPGPSLAAFVGALAAVGGVYALAGRGSGGSRPESLLLAGVALSFVFASVVMAVQVAAPPIVTAQLARALVGGVGAAGQGYGPVARALPFALLGAGAVFTARRELDLIACGEDLARTRGVNVRRVRRMLFFGVSLMTAGVVAMCGPIGFVGLMVPHMCRAKVGPGHARLVPASAAGGAGFLVLADMGGRALGACTGGAEWPAGLVTALLGGPFFLYLLKRRPAG